MRIFSSSVPSHRVITGVGLTFAKYFEEEHLSTFSGRHLDNGEQLLQYCKQTTIRKWVPPIITERPYETRHYVMCLVGTFRTVILITLTSVLLAFVYF